MNKSILLEILNELEEYKAKHPKAFIEMLTNLDIPIDLYNTALEAWHNFLTNNGVVEAWLASFYFIQEETGKLDKLEKRFARLEQLIRHSLHVEPPCYASYSGLVRLPDIIIQELDLQDGGGLSFILNKETGRYEIWTTEQVEKELLGCKD